MIKNIFNLVLLICTSLIFAQNNDVLSEVDSIFQHKWNENLQKIDSLEKPKIVKVDSKIKESIVVAPTEKQVDTPSEPIPITPYSFINMKNNEQHWFLFGQNSLVFNQASFSNWNAGGNNSVGIFAKADYSLIYKNEKHFLENVLQLGYGLVATEGQSTRKTDDNINIQTNYGYELARTFYLSAGMQFISQFSKGYNYSKTPNPISEDRISQFLAPAYINLGLGITYNPSENLQVVLRLFNGQFTYVGDPLLQKAGKYGLERDGQKFRGEFGARVNILHRVKLFKNAYFTQKLNLFANYLALNRVDITYTGMFNLKFNKYIDVNVNIDLMYDDDQVKKLQRKQTLGIGLNYTFGGDSSKKVNTKLLRTYNK